ncbi:helix-turn-helix domain-containing protein [Epibacterium ulvae]|uniref:helix-turn-helix domain-containing protein n=1 Tax=Epibacterium ulvae TaxID=1156985 RepID=UPI00248F8762|nr:helix-turn-helix domain-containing protein [Epibacterium ulvae]
MTNFSNLLRQWRQTRRLSQLDLALEANVSARHISFLETGRARPSREMITRLGEALTVPLSARNQMLTATGFKPRYETRDWDEIEMAPVRRAIERTLDRHAPYPGIAIDRLWRLTRMNTPAKKMFGMLGLAEGGSLLDLLRNPLLWQTVENWPEVAHHSMLRLRTESIAQGGVPELDAAAAFLAEHANIGHDIGPTVPTVFKIGDKRLAMFGTIAQFGTPEDTTLEELKIELFFPSDVETELALETMFGQAN